MGNVTISHLEAGSPYNHMKMKQNLMALKSNQSLENIINKPSIKKKDLRQKQTVKTTKNKDLMTIADSHQNGLQIKIKKQENED